MSRKWTIVESNGKACSSGGSSEMGIRRLHALWRVLRESPRTRFYDAYDRTGIVCKRREDRGNWTFYTLTLAPRNPVMRAHVLVNETARYIVLQKVTAGLGSRDPDWTLVPAHLRA